MNGRLTKIFMKSRLLRIKEGIHNKSWYPEWDDKESPTLEENLP